MARSTIENFAQISATLWPAACTISTQGVLATGTISRVCGLTADVHQATTGSQVRKLIAFDDDTFDKLTQLGRDRMATIQELADEAFADVLKKHGIPLDLKDALRKSVKASATKTLKTKISKKAAAKNKSDGVRKARS
jgi:hypothetical protein